MKSLFFILTQIILVNWVHAISSGDSAAISFFLQSPPEYIWNNLANGSTPWHQLSTQCKRHLQLASQAINSGQVWPFRFLDASAKLPSGFLDGTVTSLGDYDECLDITSGVKDDFIEGAYCMVRFTKAKADTITTTNSNSIITSNTQDTHDTSKSAIQNQLADGLALYNTFTLNIGICLPSSCTQNDIRSLLHLMSPLAKVSQDEIYCDSTQSNNKRMFSLTSSQLISWIYLLALYVLLVTSTICHGMRWSKNRFLLCFSMLKSFGRLIKPEKGRNSIVDDTRWVMAFTVTIIHSFACATEFRALAKMSRLRTDFWSKFTWISAQPYFNVIGIDGFFTIAGLATVWSVSKSIKEGNVLKGALKTLLSRWLRFAPELLTLLAIEMIWPAFGSGPMYTELTSYIYQACESKWWMTLFALNNIANDPSNTCLVHTWYLAAEFQLFALGIIALILLQLYPKLGKLYCILMIFTGMIVPAVKAYYGQAPTTTIHQPTFDQINSFIKEMYFPAYCHLTPFFMGLVTCVAIQKGHLNLALAKRHKITLYLLHLAFVFTIYFPAYWNYFNMPIEPVSSAIYSFAHRFIFTLGLLSTIGLGFLFKEWVLSFLKGDTLSKNSVKSLNNNNINNNDNDMDNKSSSNNNSHLGDLGDKNVNEKSKKKLLQLVSPVLNDESRRSLQTSSTAMKNVRVIFKCMSQLYFSLYLTHSIFIRYHFFSSRSMFIFDTHWNILRAGYCFSCSMPIAILFFLAVERPFEELRHLILGKKVKSA